MSRRLTVLGASLVSLVALALYVRTLAPGLVAIEDTPKFQFVGHILGTAHPPGYPLFVVVSHLFGWLPIGTVAWRINLLSAVCASLTVWCCQLAAVELGVAPAIAAVAGLGLATGAGFWFSATIAEVYALHGTLVAAMTLALLLWRRTDRAAWFFAAIACFSLGLGHHTSIVMTGPAVAIFAIMLAPRFALRPRTVAAILGCFALGFSQYLFVLVRTRQGAWGEAPASNLHELWDVVRGARWAGYVAPLSVDTLAERVPAVLLRLTHELSVPVALLALIGLVALGRRDRPSLAYLVMATTGVVLFSAFFAGQTDGFLQPAFVFAWLLAAVGLDGLAALVPRASTARVAGAAALGVLVAWQAVSAFPVRDLSHRRFEMRYFDALTRQLPPKSGLVAEDFLVDRMVLYERFTTPTFEARELAAPIEAVPERVREFDARRYGLFAFAKAASNLRREGLAFDYAPWPLTYGPVRQFLDDQPAGSLVAMAVPAMMLGPALSHDAAPFDRIGGTVPRPAFTNVAVIGARGASGAVQRETAQQETAVVSLARGQQTGGASAPVDLAAVASYDRASIRVSGRAIIESAQPVLAVWNPEGGFVAALAVTPEGLVPMPPSAVSVYHLRREEAWTRLGRESRDMTHAAVAGTLMVRQPSSAAGTVIYAARRERELAPRLFDVPASLGALDVQPFRGGSASLRDALTRDGWPPHAALESMPRVYRIALPPAVGTFALGFGGVPDHVEGRAAADGAPVAFYSVDLSGQLERIDAATERLHVARDYHQMFLGAGWSPVGADESGGFVLSLSPEAELLLPCTPACASVRLQLSTEAGGTEVSLMVDGTPLPAQPLVAGWRSYTWALPAGVGSAGMHTVVLKPGRQVRLADVLVTTR